MTQARKGYFYLVVLLLLFNIFAIAAQPAEICCPVTWGLNSEYHCRSCTHCPVPFIIDSLETPTLLDHLIAPQPAISPPCPDCQCVLPSLPQVQEAVATSSSAPSGWLALHPDCWSSDTFCWVLQWEEVTQRKRFVLSLQMVFNFSFVCFCLFFDKYKYFLLSFLVAQLIKVCH